MIPDHDDGRHLGFAYSISTGPLAWSEFAEADHDGVNPYYPERGRGDCDGSLRMDDLIHVDLDEGVLAYDPTWDDIAGDPS